MLVHVWCHRISARLKYIAATHTRETLSERFDNSIYQKCDFTLASYVHFCIMYMLSHSVIESEVGAYIIWILMNDDVQCSSPLSCKSQIVIFYSWASFRSYPFMHTLIPHSLHQTENFQFAFNAFIDEENSIKIDFTSLASSHENFFYILHKLVKTESLPLRHFDAGFPVK